VNDSPLSHREATEAKVGKRRYVVKLNADERQQLKESTCKGKSPAKQQLKARILLQADESPAGAKWSDTQISEALGTYLVMCARVRRQWVGTASGGQRRPFRASSTARRRPNS
jgi:hypothetical protein